MDTMRCITTIGVYDFDADSFIRTRHDAGVTKLLDIRQRRGVRGTQYAWANARRLQRLLADAHIGYVHHPELAPTTELRRLQYREDDRQGVGKRSRIRLAPEYIRRYTEEILDLLAERTLPVRRTQSRWVGVGTRLWADVARCAGGVRTKAIARIAPLRDGPNEDICCRPSWRARLRNGAGHGACFAPATKSAPRRLRLLVSAIQPCIRSGESRRARSAER